jgi:16S rRNA processing protein RimM
MFGERSAVIVRRAGTDEHPIVRLEGIEDRGGAEALRGTELTVELAAAPELEEGEWWAQELEGCEVVDGQRRVGTVVGLIELPSCEALRVRLLASPAGDEGHTRLHASPADGDSQAAGAPGAELLVPMVRDAIRHVDPAAGRIEVDMSFLEEMQ